MRMFPEKAKNVQRRFLRRKLPDLPREHPGTGTTRFLSASTKRKVMMAVKGREKTQGRWWSLSIAKRRKTW
jgi:hypothetical protein